MNKDQYFAKMRETSNYVYPIILEKVDSILHTNKQLHSTVRFIIDKRKNRQLLLKPFLLRLAYELCGGADWKETALVGAAFELLNISSYQANSAFDGKYLVFSSDDKNSQFIASMITRELSLELLTDAIKDHSPEIINLIANDISKSNKYIYIAQHYDLNLLNIKNLSKYQNESKFFDDYEKRCRYGSGIVSGLCAQAGGLLAKAPQNALLAIKSFGEEYGTGLHVMNDLADFVPPESSEIINRNRESDDQFSDLKNGRLTLGCYKFFTSSSDTSNIILKKIASGQPLNEHEINGIVAFLIKSGGVDSIIEYGSKYEIQANKELNSFQECNAKALLSLMASACRINKFTLALTRLKI